MKEEQTDPQIIIVSYKITVKIMCNKYQLKLKIKQHFRRFCKVIINVVYGEF